MLSPSVMAKLAPDAEAPCLKTKATDGGNHVATWSKLFKSCSLIKLWQVVPLLVSCSTFIYYLFAAL